MTDQEPGPEREPEQPAVDRFAYYALGIQAIVSIIALVLSFWLIVQETEAGINTSAFNVITFIVGVWLGRGIDYGIDRARRQR